MSITTFDLCIESNSVQWVKIRKKKRLLSEDVARSEKTRVPNIIMRIERE